MRSVMDARVGARPLAIARIGVGIATMITLLEGVMFLAEIHAGKIAMPLFDWTPGPSPAPLGVLLAVGAAAAVALTMGLRTRHAVIVSVAIELVIFCWDQQTYSNHRFLITMLLAYLAFARPEAAWSVSARGKPGALVPYWPQLLMMTQLSACYLFAGLSKLNPVFLSGHVLASEVPSWVPTAAIVTASCAAVAVELFLAAGLWFKRSRRLAIILGLGLHISIVVLMAQHLVLAAFALACASLYPLFLYRPTLNGETPDALRRRPDALIATKN